MIRLVFAESAAEVQAAAEWLRGNGARLEPSFRSYFAQSSRFHGDAGFSPSFIMPPPKQPPAGSLASTPYELPRDAVRGARPSVVFSLVPPDDMVGKYRLSMNHVTGQQYLPHGECGVQAVAPRNVHGGSEFPVKVQPPLGDGAGPCGFCSRKGATTIGLPTWGCMVYDERRSFESFLPLDCPAITPLLELVRDRGWRRGAGQPGIKGYFIAKREGDNLRIFVDRLLPQPHW